MKKKLVIAFCSVFLLVAAFFVISSKQGNMPKHLSAKYVKADNDEYVYDGSEEEYVFLLGYEE